jgi:hypothetical protein
MQSDTKQRRHRIRVTFRQPVTLLRHASTPSLERGWTIDVSSGGALLDIGRALPIGDAVTLVLPLGDEDLRLKATVVRVVEPPGALPLVGVRFDRCSPDDIADLTRTLFAEAKRQGLGNRRVAEPADALAAPALYECIDDPAAAPDPAWAALLGAWVNLPDDW